jgi:Polyketide cyclase / dehydrase and lipid transport
MTAIVESIEIARRPDDVFAYATDLSRYPEWQRGVGSARLQGDGPIRAGSRAVMTRRVGPRMVEYIEEMAEFDPPRSWTVRSIGGLPVTAIAQCAIEPLDGSERSRVTITLDFKARGIGKLLLPLVVRRQARKTLPKEARELKEILERHT